jgi:hypothetical protein
MPGHRDHFVLCYSKCRARTKSSRLCAFTDGDPEVCRDANGWARLKSAGDQHSSKHQLMIKASTKKLRKTSS